ncbi:hypothetical protein RLJV_23785 [Pseudomonas aeruginosa]|nr:hypothetical protein RLJV_23785 [Pseudomonas aeruginosa]
MTLVLLLLAWRLQRSGLVWPTALMLLGLSLQIGLGISNVLLHLPLPVAAEGRLTDRRMEVRIWPPSSIATASRPGATSSN